VTKSLKSWMFEAREASRAVGKGALESMELRGRRWNSRRRKEVNGHVRLAKINGPVELGVSERHECTLLFTFFTLYSLSTRGSWLSEEEREAYR